MHYILLTKTNLRLERVEKELVLFVVYDTYTSSEKYCKMKSIILLFNMEYRIICQLRCERELIVHDCLARNLSYREYNNVQVK